MNVRSYPQQHVLDSASLANAWISNHASLKDMWLYGAHREGVFQRMRAGGPETSRRKAVGNAIRDQYARSGLEAPTSLRDLELGAPVVTTGHQLQLMGGAAFLHYKILSTIRWASTVSQPNQRAVPVFWLASEDHDFKEISEVGDWGDRPSFKWNRSTADSVAVGRLKYDLETNLLEWARSAGVTSLDQKSLEVSQSNAHLADAVRHWVHAWFGADGVIVVDGDSPELKALAEPLFRAEWEGKGIFTSVQSATQKLEAMGWKGQVLPRENNLFHLAQDGTRTRADRWTASHGDDSWQDEDVACWSPNALLRPLYQEFLLESVVVVGGPGEVAYWLQLGAAFAHHGLQAPALMLRDGALVLPEKAADAVSVLNWEPDQGLVRGDEAVARWVTSQLPKTPELEAAWGDWEAALEAYVDNVDVSMLPATRSALVQMEQVKSQLEKKLKKGVRLRNAAYCAQIHREFDHVISVGGKPQERSVNGLVLASQMGGWSAWKKAWLTHVGNVDSPVFLMFEKLSIVDRAV